MPITLLRNCLIFAFLFCLIQTSIIRRTRVPPDAGSLSSGCSYVVFRTGYKTSNMAPRISHRGTNATTVEFTIVLGGAV